MRKKTKKNSEKGSNRPEMFNKRLAGILIIAAFAVAIGLLAAFNLRTVQEGSDFAAKTFIWRN